jgi:hypothetical protein
MGTELGTCTASRSLEMETSPLAGATLERVTVQIVLAFALRVVVAHCNDERATGAISERAAVLETPAREAVMVAL